MFDEWIIIYNKKNTNNDIYRESGKLGTGPHKLLKDISLLQTKNINLWI